MSIYCIDRFENFAQKYQKKFLFTLLALQSILLVAFFAANHFQVPYTGDTPTYIEPAKNLLMNGTLTNAAGEPILFRTPGYSFFLALIYSLTNSSNTVVIILQMGMVLATSWLIFTLTKAMSKRVLFGCLAAFFYACDLAVYSNAVLILTDTIFPFLLVLSLWMFWQYLQCRKLRYFAGCVFLLNYALLVRPQIMYYNLILVFVIFIGACVKKIPWKVCAIYIVGFAIAFGGWSVRNYQVFGQAMYTSIRDESYYRWYAPETYALKEHVSIEDANLVFERLMDETYPNYEQMSKLEQVAAEKDIGLSYLKENIGWYLLLNVKGLITELVGPNMTTIYLWGLPNICYWLCCCAFGGMLLLSYLVYAVGFLRSFLKQTWFDWLILLTVMYLMASTAVLGYSRFRLAFYPLCLIGAFSCWKLKAEAVS